MNKIIDFLLTDESYTSKDDYLERQLLAQEFSKQPEEFFSHMRHFQPQVGCLNCCAICSKKASTIMEYWNINRIRNIVSAIKFTVKAYRKEKPLLAWGRTKHRVGVVFSYLDNDIGSYEYLSDFIEIVHRELGVQIRLSTVGYSRYNDILNHTHRRVNSSKLLPAIGGVRLSITPYAIGWAYRNSKQYSREDYINDIANFLDIYKPYYNYVGSGRRNMCVELRFKPLVKLCNVNVYNMHQHTIILADNIIYISQQKNIQFEVANIKNQFIHAIDLDKKPLKFWSFEYTTNMNITLLLEQLKDVELDNMKLVDVYMLKNREGIYYSISPKISENGNKGINIYPVTPKRKKSGCIITERFFLNALINVKHQLGLTRKSKFNNATWLDVEHVLSCLKEQLDSYKSKDLLKAKYIECEVIPMISGYVEALKLAGYSPADFFNPQFTIDTGIICNLGKSLNEFKGITNLENEPLTPTHERNYGKNNSTMTTEGVAWRLSCEHNNQIIIEELELMNTATKEGQTSRVSKISLSLEQDNKFTFQDLNYNYLVPGQRY